MRRALLALTMVMLMAFVPGATVVLGQGVIANSYVDNVFYEQPRWVVEIIHSDGRHEWQAQDLAEQRPTGQGNSGPFYEGEAVVGFRVTLADGRVAEGGCYLAIAPPGGGTVTDGKVNPYAAETNGVSSCNFSPPRRPSGEGGTIGFSAGEPVVGAFIRLDDGTERRECYWANPHRGGRVTSGVVYPLPGERNIRAC